ncbi:hypothetical protein U14_05366 [Candidatus Moduliflexus flocculans]|uniref:Methyltransferase domain-containing protein n=1 Tax=Candidatus Moduliflexus flocculans TaxID=1499966 RepID=A0A081BRQ8_9BACT|nr:hypothetical protein U14_05366 [Candidatus Moduliflexus flocculans]
MNLKSIAQKYWETHPHAASQGQWTSNPIIGETVYRRMSGGQSSKHWLSWLIESYFYGKHFQRVLCPGCGVGSHEIILAKSGIANVIDAFDFSEASILFAPKEACKAHVKINFYIDDLNTFSIPEGIKYDLVICSGSLHHVKELERFLSLIQKILHPDGYFIVNEYVGDCYNIYNDKQIDIINKLLACFPPELRSSSEQKFKNATIEQVMQHDPSECVRSKLILPFLEYYFIPEFLQLFGGSILHILYPLLNNNSFSNLENLEASTIVRLLLVIPLLPGMVGTPALFIAFFA